VLFGRTHRPTQRLVRFVAAADRVTVGELFDVGAECGRPRGISLQTVGAQERAVVETLE
jgi:hypothetical protein